MRNRSIWAGVFLATAFPALGGLRAEESAEAKSSEAAADAVFPMAEISVFDAEAAGDSHRDLLRGARGVCEERPHEAVKAYPKLRSKKPIYGVLRLAPQPYREDSGAPLYFVADESGETAAEEEPAKKDSADESSLLSRLSAALRGEGAVRPKVKDPAKLRNTYDRLYIDLNGDLDLTNDRVVAPMKDPPSEAIPRYSSLRQAVVFEEISVPLDLGPELGSRRVRLVPRLLVQEYEDEEHPGVELLSAVVRAGEIKLGNQQYHAILAQRYVVTGRYDSPLTTLFLRSQTDPDRREYWWGADQLRAIRLVEGQYYTTSTTPLGDNLIVKRYQGDFGVLRIGPGDRELEQLTIQGSLESKTAALAVGEPSDSRSGSLRPVTECRLPVGDYLPDFVTIEYGTLRLSVSQNYHSDGKPRDINPEAWVYGIKIRKDKPFVWDFSNSPEVMFASPAKDETYKPGDEIKVMAVLIDPKLTIMIRRLNDTGRTEKKTLELSGGRTTTYEQSVSLDPIVTITNAAGKQVAEGPMPFG